MARIVFVGLPGAGKTSLARALARRWGCASVDTDDLIADAVGTSAAQYLRSEGEAAFRDRELVALRSALGADAIVATGSGVVTTGDALLLLRNETTLWLDCGDAELLERMDDGDRPLLAGDRAAALGRLRRQREPLYGEVARARVDASGTIDEVIARVEAAMNEVSP